ncbi:hypothetical protein Taro_044367 [Colocasia esculenta]|uniref:Uncharacterized protein n=1 Tax=Colocasia esculenta TaxID=4460 RepID=A0A843WY51_COLES|nr:hypothetical protein [Colocasia esculenta]
MLQVGCNYCCAVYVANVVARRVCTVAARLALDSLAVRCDTCLWLLSAWCWLVVNSSEVLQKFFSIGSGGSEVSPELIVFCCPGEGFSQGCFVLVSSVVVLPQSLSVSFGWAAFCLLGHCRSRCCALGRASDCCVGQLASLFISEFLDCAGGTSCAPVVRWFASSVAPGMLLRMVV